MNQSPPEATGAGEHQTFLQLQDGSTIPYCTLRPEIGLIRQEICRRTNIAVFNQRLTLAGRELHTGDNILTNCTIILDFNHEAGPVRMADSKEVLNQFAHYPLHTIKFIPEIDMLFLC